MKALVLTCLLFFTSPILDDACECITLPWASWKKEHIESAIDYSDLIFIGEVLNVYNEHYEFKVSEAFKGDLTKGDVVSGYYISSCSGWPLKRRKGEWIFYGKYHCNNNNESMLDYSQCGPTRNLRYPAVFSKEENKKYWQAELKMLNSTFNKNVELVL